MKHRTKKHEGSKAYKAAHPFYLKVICKSCGAALTIKRAAKAHCKTCGGITEVE
jgi:ribosomal protein S27E